MVYRNSEDRTRTVLKVLIGILLAFLFCVAGVGAYIWHTTGPGFKVISSGSDSDSKQ